MACVMHRAPDAAGKIVNSSMYVCIKTATKIQQIIELWQDKNSSFIQIRHFNYNLMLNCRIGEQCSGIIAIFRVVN